MKKLLSCTGEMNPLLHDLVETLHPGPGRALITVNKIYRIGALVPAA